MKKRQPGIVTVAQRFLHPSFCLLHFPKGAAIFVEHEITKQTQLRRKRHGGCPQCLCRPDGTVSLAQRMGEGGRRPSEGLFCGSTTMPRLRRSIDPAGQWSDVVSISVAG
jgi:hypothetical protein